MEKNTRKVNKLYVFKSAMGNYWVVMAMNWWDKKCPTQNEALELARSMIREPFTVTEPKKDPHGMWVFQHHEIRPE